MGKELHLRGEFLCSRLSSAIKPCILYLLLPRQECVTDEWVGFGLISGHTRRFPGPALDEINPKKKILERLFPDMKTDAGAWLVLLPSHGSIQPGCQHVRKQPHFLS